MGITQPAHRLVVVRHGESEFNAQNRFTGWIDCGLTALGVEEAQRAGRALREQGFGFDRIYTSVLRRCTDSTLIIRAQLADGDVPVWPSWRLNERHYGALQGLNKAETASRFGEQQVHLWRRSYAVRPPALDAGDPMNPARDPRYANVPAGELPLTESLEDTVRRVLPYWSEEIGPAIRRGLRVLIVAHGNSIRGLIKHLDTLSDDAIVGVVIPTAVPLIYDLDERLDAAGRRYLDIA